MTTQHYDYIVIGSGIAGLYSALLAVEHGSVLILTKGGIADCNTQYAQGGIAAAVGPEDSPSYHLADTLAAGAGCATRTPPEFSPSRVRRPSRSWCGWGSSSTRRTARCRWGARRRIGCRACSTLAATPLALASS